MQLHLQNSVCCRGCPDLCNAKRDKTSSLSPCDLLSLCTQAGTEVGRVDCDSTFSAYNNCSADSLGWDWVNNVTLWSTPWSRETAVPTICQRYSPVLYILQEACFCMLPPNHRLCLPSELHWTFCKSTPSTATTTSLRRLMWLWLYAEIDGEHAEWSCLYSENKSSLVAVAF